MALWHSQSAGWLTVNVDVGPLVLESGHWAWGIRVGVSALTVYDIYDETMDDAWVKVAAEYRRRLYLPCVKEKGAEAMQNGGSWIEAEAEVHLSEWRP